MTEPSAPSRILVDTPRRGALHLEFRRIDAERPDAPLLVFLHEGLGSVAQWRDWPDRLCRQAGLRGLVYSRYGYGASTPRPADERWQPDYLLEQARDHLPALLRALGLELERLWIYGHSDGGTIALLHAALHPERVRGIAVAAPHVFVEPETLAAIAAVRDQYVPSGLRERLKRHHADPDSAFGGWSGAWLNPPFAHWDIRPDLAGIRCPVLAIQGREDEYASLEQIHDIARRVPQTEVRVLDHCGHSPHRDQPEAVIGIVMDWMARVS
jgi:pimeloyl-ACP methyl ester carboxylesterase